MPTEVAYCLTTVNITGLVNTARQKGFSTEVGITCYSSADLGNWRYEGVALAVSEEEGSDIERGCIMERPKVIYNGKTGNLSCGSIWN